MAPGADRTPEGADGPEEDDGDYIERTKRPPMYQLRPPAMGAETSAEEDHREGGGESGLQRLPW